MSFYTDAQRDLQAAHDSVPLAQALEAAIVTTELDERQRGFIESRDFFFLSTVNDRGEPTVSYKGGGTGVVRVLDDSTVAFPFYDGNGMFLSAGNIADTAAIGMLFIDFETPQRVRVQASARLSDDAGLLASWPGAIAVVVAEVTAAFVNCARYIHPHERRANSSYVPDDDGVQPHPSWKQIDLLQPVLSEADQQRTIDGGGPIDEAEYGRRLMAGES